MSNINYTRGIWVVDFRGTKGHIKAVDGLSSPTVCRYSGTVLGCPVVAISLSEEETEANAHLIAASVNACISVNPKNPIIVAGVLPDVYKALKDLKRALEVEASDRAKVHLTHRTLSGLLSQIL